MRFIMMIDVLRNLSILKNKSRCALIVNEKWISRHERNLPAQKKKKEKNARLFKEKENKRRPPGD